MRNYYKGIALDMKARNMKPSQLREYLQECCKCDYSMNKNSDYDENIDNDHHEKENFHNDCFWMVEIIYYFNNIFCEFLSCKD